MVVINQQHSHDFSRFSLAELKSFNTQEMQMQRQQIVPIQWDLIIGGFGTHRIHHPQVPNLRGRVFLDPSNATRVVHPEAARKPLKFSSGKGRICSLILARLHLAAMSLTGSIPALERVHVGAAGSGGGSGFSSKGCCCLPLPGLILPFIPACL